MGIETKYFSIDDLYNLDNKSKFWKFIEGEVKVALSKSSMSSSKKADALNLFKKQYIKKFFIRQTKYSSDLHKPWDLDNYDLESIRNNTDGTWTPPPSSDGYRFDLENAQYVIEKFIWMQIHPDDRKDLFDNDIDKFDDWVVTLSEDQIDEVVQKIQNGERLGDLDYDSIKDSLYELDDGTIRVFKIDGLMIMSSLNKDSLETACVKIFMKKGISFKYRTTKNYKGKTVHSYIFRIDGRNDNINDNMT
tara:strand:- start:109 stop:852 length:744 start_codon:yes stop_codon:yes gene_type:complete